MTAENKLSESGSGTSAVGTHTPGPWYADEKFGDTLFICARRFEGFHETIVLVSLTNDERNQNGDTTIIRKVKKPCARANANLICAAPDMLFALQMVADRDMDAELREVVTAAILKATGDRT